MQAAPTLFDRIWRDHLIAHLDDEVDLLAIDRHFVHEVSSAEAFRRLGSAGRSVASPSQTFATMDHIVSTQPGRTERTYAQGAELVEYLADNCRRHAIPLFRLDDPRQGIVHVTAAENGLVLPGATAVCGDSHTATLGALGALAWGVGTSEVEHVLATQTLAQKRPTPLAIRIDGTLNPATTPKDVILAVIRRFGLTAGVGRAVEYCGSTVRAMAMEGRMTLCNMSIELGARFGMIAPDDTTFAYLAETPRAPKGAAWEAALASWRAMAAETSSEHAETLALDVTDLAPQISWGTTPADVVDIDGRIPHRDAVPAGSRTAGSRALAGSNPTMCSGGGR